MTKVLYGLLFSTLLAGSAFAQDEAAQTDPKDEFLSHLAECTADVRTANAGDSSLKVQVALDDDGALAALPLAVERGLDSQQRRFFRFFSASLDPCFPAMLEGDRTATGTFVIAASKSDVTIDSGEVVFMDSPVAHANDDAGSGMAAATDGAPEVVTDDADAPIVQAPLPDAPGEETAQGSAGAAPEDAPAASDPNDIALWTKAVKSGAREDFQAYMQAYPEGKFADLGEIVLKKLDNSGADDLGDAEYSDADQDGSADGETDDDADTNIVADMPASENENAFSAPSNNQPSNSRSSKSFADAKALVNSGSAADLREARSILEAVAAQGDARASLLLGNLLRDGKGGPKDANAAIERYLKAGELGNQRGWRRAIRLYERKGKHGRAAKVFVSYYQSKPSAALKHIRKVKKKTIKALQRQMKSEGFYRGRIDGLFGPSSRRALRKYANW